ncbi:MAG: hypothetical protein N3F05_04385 [Candidatus Diapherotrites archaeon]|nr:hypothetical protein [Candidatus Diapherotrites archaeon]
MPSKVADNIVPQNVKHQGIYDLTEDDLKKLDETQTERIMKSLGQAKEPLRKNMKYILGVIVAIFLIFVAYLINENFLFGSYRDLTIQVKDLEKQSISENIVTIKDMSGKSVFEKSGESTYIARIQKGKYVVSVSATNYKKASKNIEIDNSKTIEIYLEKDSGVKIDSISFPTTLYIGQNFILDIKLKNYTVTNETLLLSFGNDLNLFNCRLAEIMVPANTTQDISVLCEIPENIKLKYDCEQKKAKVGIKYTNETAEKQFSLCIKPTISMSEISFTIDPVTKPNERKDIGIKNQSPFHVKDLTLGIEITSSKENKVEDILKWFAFGNVITDPRNKRTIIEIQPKSTINEPLEVSVPLTAKAETIYGNIVLDAPYLKEPVKSKLTLAIKRTPRLAFKANLTVSRTVIVYRNDLPTEITVKVQITNSGDLPIKNIDIKVDNPQECTTQWLRPLDVLSLDSVEPQKVGYITLIASAPADATKNTTKRCIISMTYEDTIKGTIETENVGVVEVVKG